MGAPVPADLRHRLQDAEEVANITELRPMLVELGELGSEHGQLARQLQERLDDVDMEGMQTLLDQLSDA